MGGGFKAERSALPTTQMDRVHRRVLECTRTAAEAYASAIVPRHPSPRGRLACRAAGLLGTLRTVDHGPEARGFFFIETFTF